jgi:hypothetical protein
VRLWPSYMLLLQLRPQAMERRDTHSKRTQRGGKPVRISKNRELNVLALSLWVGVAAFPLLAFGAPAQAEIQNRQVDISKKVRGFDAYT